MYTHKTLAKRAWIAETAHVLIESMSLWLDALALALLIALILDSIHSDGLSICQKRELVPVKQLMNHHRHPLEVKARHMLFFRVCRGVGGAEWGRQMNTYFLLTDLCNC